MSYGALKRRYFALTKSLKTSLQQWTSLPEKNPVLVYSMRKVGSTTLTKTLRHNGVNAYKMHFLNPGVIAEYRQLYGEAGGTNNHSIIEGIAFRRRLDLWRKKKGVMDGTRRIKIFTFVKDPIAIAASDYFMQLFYFLPNVVQKRGLNTPERLVASFEEVLWSAAGNQVRDPVVSYLGAICALPAIWFERELESLTGIDVCSSPFPVEKGISFYEACDCDIALIRTDRLSKVGLGAIGRLLGITPPQLITSNVRSQTPEGRLYNDFSSAIRLPERLVKKLYTRARTDVFFSVDEVERLVERWVVGRRP